MCLVLYCVQFQLWLCISVAAESAGVFFTKQILYCELAIISVNYMAYMSILDHLSLCISQTLHSLFGSPTKP